MSNNENHELSGRLAELQKRGDGFRTPEPAYFTDLAERSILAGKAPARTVGIGRKWMSLAAAVILLLVAAFTLWPTSVNDARVAEDTPVPASEEILAGIDAEDIEAYIAENLDNFETELYSAETSNFDFNE
jgi:hypothetical protein